MKRILVLGLLTFCFFCAAGAQSLSTKILRLEVDGKEVRKSYKVFFLSAGGRSEAEKTATGFVVPSELTTQEHLAVLITFGKYKLEFSDIHISKFHTDWVVGVDKKPFSEELVRPEEAEKTRRVYYIKFQNGIGLDTELVVKEQGYE
jgi:hypothetical protein